MVKGFNGKPELYILKPENLMVKLFNGKPELYMVSNLALHLLTFVPKTFFQHESKLGHSYNTPMW